MSLLHPYVGNASLLGDCLKLQSLTLREQKAGVAIGYEHDPPQVPLEPLWRAFEVVASEVLKAIRGERFEARRRDLVHPVHRQLVGVGWTIIWEPGCSRAREGSRFSLRPRMDWIDWQFRRCARSGTPHAPPDCQHGGCPLP